MDIFVHLNEVKNTIKIMDDLKVKESLFDTSKNYSKGRFGFTRKTEVKTSRIVLHLTEKEKKLINDYCNKHSLTISQLMRKALAKEING